MESQGNKKITLWLVVHIVLLVLSFGSATIRGEPQVPCYFIFGDSLVDNGNNNKLPSLARADYPPYGLDFEAGPTGRFTNGKTTVDVFAELLGFDDYIPPYANAKRGPKILKGINYASAAAGIREETGQQLGVRITFRGQVRNYKKTYNQVVDLLGGENKAKNHLSKCIFSIGMGGNDYLNNYFMPLYYTTGLRYTPEQFADDLIQKYTEQLKILYNHGARKLVLIGVGQVGCSPSELARNSNDGTTCVQRINSACQIFNDKLKSLVDRFNTNTDAKTIYINAYGMFQDVLNKAHTYGFKNTNSGCCGVGRNNGLLTCLPLQIPCENRNEYLFWDAFHPTEAANILFSRRSYIAELPSDVYPFDIRHLARL